MKARYEDYESKKFLLDIWSATWDESTANKLRYFDNCVPANGVHSNRKCANWGSDENRATFLLSAKAEMEKTVPNWKWEAEKRKIWSKKRHISIINGYLDWVGHLQSSKSLDLETIRKRLETRKKREADSLAAAIQSYEASLEFNRKKIDNKRRRLEKRRKDYVTDSKVNADETDLTVLLNLSFDCPPEQDISNTPIVLQSNSSEGIEKDEGNDLLENILDIPDEEHTVNEEPTDVKTEKFYQLPRELSDTESHLTDFNCFSEKSHEQEECKSRSDWFRACSSCSRENDFQSNLSLSGLSDEEEPEILSSKSLDGSIYIEDDKDETLKSQNELSTSCNYEKCCVNLCSNKNVNGPIACLSHHISEMVVKSPQTVILPCIHAQGSEGLGVPKNFPDRGVGVFSL